MCRATSSVDPVCLVHDSFGRGRPIAPRIPVGAGPGGTDLARALAADLSDLAVDLSGGGYTLTTLEMLDRDLRRSVPSSLGVSVILEVGTVFGRPVTVNLVPRIVEPHEIAATLTIRLARLASPLTGRLVFYAAQPSAFAQLADGLAEALHLLPGDVDQRTALPDTPVTPIIEGLQDFSVVNRALGVLINRCHTVTAARSELRRRAEQSQVDLTTAALTILGSIDHETT